MKRFLSSIVALSLLLSATAQTKPAAKPAAKPVAPVFKNQNDSISYSLGMSLASFYKQQGITNINTSLLNRAINDIMKPGSKPLLTEEQMTSCLNGFLQKKQAEKQAATQKANAGIIEANHKAGAAFLEANKSKPGVITTASGLQYVVLKQGDGPKPLPTDKVKCHYHGTLIDGSVFESSVASGKPIEFNVTGVIPGWVEALQMMPVGSKWKLFLPSDLAYGDYAAGPKIGPGSTLIFEVELLEIVK
jgi:FKBP-type peptidyl-prolyl cis-trans isomerase FklB